MFFNHCAIIESFLASPYKVALSEEVAGKWFPVFMIASISLFEGLPDLESAKEESLHISQDGTSWKVREDR